MSRLACYCLVLILAWTSLVAARSNICLSEGNVVYKPLQLYPTDCPGHLNDCTSYVYNYSAPLFKSKSVASILPKSRESLVYMTQDDDDNLDVVVITATTYKNTIINTQIHAVGASPADILLKDDPTEDTWYWDSANNYGNFSWLLQPGYTDGLVLGHLKIIDNFCLTVTFLPNWVGAITNISLLSGNMAKTSRVFSKLLGTTAGVPTSLEFCLYPQILVSKTDASCGTLGSASAVSLNYTASATFLWTKDGVTVGTTSQIKNLQPGTYNLTVNVNGCEAKRTVTIETNIQNPVTFTAVSTAATLKHLGKVDLSISGGTPPYSISWKDAAGNVVSGSANAVSLNLAGGNYSVTVTDGCTSLTLVVSVAAPIPCVAGFMVASDGTCSICPAGTYSSSVNAENCTVCPIGSYNVVKGAASCIQCSANAVSNGGTSTCSDCPQNTFSAAGSAAICTPCPLGTDRASGASSCSSCDAGQFRCSSSALCSVCQAGTFGTVGKSSCELCNPGTYQSGNGSTSCTTCPANTYAAAGAAACIACPAGTTAPAGSSVLLACM